MLSVVSRGVLLLSLCSAVSAFGAERLTTIPIRTYGTIQLSIPDSWGSQIGPAQDNVLSAMTFLSRDGLSFKLMLAAVAASGPGQPLPNAEGIKADVEMAAERARLQSVEKELPLRRIKGDSVDGFYFTSTSLSTLPREQFRFMTQGLFRLGELLMGFTALTDDPSGKVLGGIITVLERASEQRDRTLAPPPSTQSPSGRPDEIQVSRRGNNYLLTVGPSRISMSLPAGALTRRIASASGVPDSPRYFHFEDRGTKLIVSGWFNPAEQFIGAKALWEKDKEAWKKARFPEPRNVSFRKVGSWDTVAYEMRFTGGVNLNLRAHQVRAGTWVEVHLSITSNQVAAAKARLNTLLGTIVISEKKETLPSGTSRKPKKP